MKSEAYLLAISQNAVTTAIPEGVSPMLSEQEDARAQALLDEGVAWLRERGVTAHGALEFGNAVDRIAETAESIGADLIILGHKTRGRLARWWSESDEATLLERARC